ncbi:MAG TPA: hypothetical protein VNL77_04895 [Roseiflexaceae bacterium]|nr:hypothetical protein [Roseiflexaceae bacterium]
MDQHAARPAEPHPPAFAGAIRFLTVLLALSLALHAATIYTLYQVRETTRARALALADELGAAQDQVIRVSVPLNHPIPVQASVPIRKTISVPIETTIPLNTRFTVPLDTPFGTYEVPVPIRGEVPVRIDAPVTIDDTVLVSTTIALDTTLPLALPVRETPLANYIERMRRALLELADQL